MRVLLLIQPLRLLLPQKDEGLALKNLRSNKIVDCCLRLQAIAVFLEEVATAGAGVRETPKRLDNNLNVYMHVSMLFEQALKCNCSRGSSKDTPSKCLWLNTKEARVPISTNVPEYEGTHHRLHLPVNRCHRSHHCIPLNKCQFV